MAARGAPTGQWPSLSAKPGAVLKMRLLVRRPKLPEVEIPLDRRRFVIGRATEGVDLTLTDELVSRQHAEITVNEQGYVTLKDLGSKNGIEYAGRAVRQLNLNDGDSFSIGETELSFRAELTRFKAVEAPPAEREASEIHVPAPRAAPSAAARAGHFDEELARASDIPDPEPSRPGGPDPELEPPPG